jgi:hypothetical protein
MAATSAESRMKKTCRGGAAAAGGDVHDHGHGTGDDLFDNVPHGTVQPPRRADLKKNGVGSLLDSLLHARRDELGRDRVNDAIQLYLDNLGSPRGNFRGSLGGNFSDQQKQGATNGCGSNELQCE